jgi:hypothetical protein
MSDFIVKMDGNGGTLAPYGGMECLNLFYKHYEVINDRLIILTYQSSDCEISCKCNIKYDMKLLEHGRKIAKNNNIVVESNGVLCQFCQKIHGMGYCIDNNIWCCMDCFDKSIRLNNKLNNKYCVRIDGDEEMLLINEFVNNPKVEHNHMGYIADEGDVIYNLNFINREYRIHGYSKYYKPGVSRQLYRLHNPIYDICHITNETVNNDGICYDCYKFVEARFLRENAPKMLLLREIDLLVDVIGVITRAFIAVVISD